MDEGGGEKFQQTSITQLKALTLDRQASSLVGTAAGRKREGVKEAEQRQTVPHSAAEEESFK